MPNQSGRSLRQGTTNAVGFMIELNPETASSDNFFMGVFDGVQSVLMRHGLDLIVLPCPTGEDPVPYLRRFVARGAVDAMILSATQRIDPRIELLQSAGLPFLTLGRSTSGNGYAWIDLDFEGVVNQSIDRCRATTSIWAMFAMTPIERRCAGTGSPTKPNWFCAPAGAKRAATR